MGSPYRTPPTREAPSPRPDEECEGAVRVLVFVVWITSGIRAGGAIFRHENFGTEPTLALAVVFLLPWLFRDALRIGGRRPK